MKLCECIAQTENRHHVISDAPVNIKGVHCIDMQDGQYLLNYDRGNTVAIVALTIAAGDLSSLPPCKLYR